MYGNIIESTEIHHEKFQLDMLTEMKWNENVWLRNNNFTTSDLDFKVNGVTFISNVPGAQKSVG